MGALAAYASRPIKRERRTKAEIEDLCKHLAQVVASDPPMTVRQVFYQMVSRGAIAKTETEYKQTVGRLLLQLRRNGSIPYGWISDETRWRRKPPSYNGLRDMLEQEKRLYRRALWEEQTAYIEVWLEKEALAGVLVQVTEEWDVPLMVTRGYASESYLYSAAETISDRLEAGKDVFVYYFGDHDPSGVNIPQVVERRLREMMRELDSSYFSFDRIAVTETQIRNWKLPTRPTKQTDTRARSFTGESVEVDAIPPGELRQLVRDCIEQHVDERQLASTLAIERAERQSLAALIDQLPADHGGTG